MLICSEKDQISFPFNNGGEELECSDSTNGIPSLEEFPTISAHANLVPEHSQSDLSRLMSTLEEEIMELKSKQKDLDVKRRGLLNKILDIKGSIRVFCRIRPMLCNNVKKYDDPFVVDLDKVIVRSSGIKKEFEFDRIFCQNSTQEDVFVEVEPILRSALDGHNVCVFAYGQTGTGKTFTMEGSKDQPGIVPRALKELFQQAALESDGSVTFSMSMLEVYMGNLKDLLAPKPARRVYEPVSRCNLNVQVDAKGVVEIEGLSEVPISDFSKASWWYSKGRRARATSSTNVNDVSSRSHCLTRITIGHHGDTPESQPRISKLWMVDLGGSERLLKTGATGLTLDEGRAINLSLSALGDVIASLKRRRTHVPYRNSKLTQILRDSLGNESKVLMIVHISPIEEDVGETVCSMSFAKRARGIESNHELPQEVKNLRQKRVTELSNEMREAEEEYQKVSNQLQKAQFLLKENNRLLQAASNNVEEEQNTLESTKECIKEVNDATPCDPEKPPKKKSLPHFMASTAASRLRHSAAERQNHFTARVLRSGTKSSMQLSASQSLSFLEPRLKAVLKNCGTNHHEKAGKNLPTEAQNCNNGEPKPSNLSRNKLVTPSLINGKPTVSRHRRRVSALM